MQTITIRMGATKNEITTKGFKSDIPTGRHDRKVFARQFVKTLKDVGYFKKS